MKVNQIKTETLPNGVKIVSEKLDHVRTVAIGIWVQSGARHEPEELCGISHFIEHMVFKGTEKRTAREIAEQMDAIGGQMNAYTSNECTCFYARSLDSHFNRASDILCDIFFNSKFAPEDIKNERNVVYEEIGMYEDSPEDLAVDRLNEAVFKGSSLGRPILGTKKTLKSFNQQILKKYRDEHYTSESIIVSVAGNFTEKEIDDLKNRFSNIPKADKCATPKAEYRQAVTLKKKEIEQNHLCLAYPIPGYASEERYTIQLLSNMLGGGMSSRLFQKVREEAGLCYSISAFTGMTHEQGLFCINTALSKDTEEQAIKLILEEIEKICTFGVSEEELSRVREQQKANILMALENSGSRMNTLAQSVVRYGRVFTPDEITDAIDKITTEHIAECAREIFKSENLSFSGVGQLRTGDWYKRKLGIL